ncbi:Oligouridylate-binding protein 1B [Camellia lanceoleosa]|uniref:Oligouridylate-binding protein 1B n=1 Tax=Camellia lanceoleosa TaxID=1840588 RepID=A0ACC0FCC4_9ERIC|nr:Oligouridylate-binding protein 1B [Camellia lanceoleosa]
MARLILNDFTGGFENRPWWQRLLNGYSTTTWLVVLNLGSTGLLVSWLMKYADNIVKLLAVAVIGFGIWMSSHNDGCRKSPTLPVLGLGAVIFVISIIGFLGAWKSNSILLWIIEPIPSGNLPPGFDPSTCRSVYVGNIHTQVTEPLIQEVFSITGPVEGCELIRKEKSSYGFIHYFDRRSAALAILSLNGRHLFGQPIKVNWAYAILSLSKRILRILGWASILDPPIMSREEFETQKADLWRKRAMESVAAKAPAPEPAATVEKVFKKTSAKVSVQKEKILELVKEVPLDPMAKKLRQERNGPRSSMENPHVVLYGVPQLASVERVAMRNKQLKSGMPHSFSTQRDKNLSKYGVSPERFGAYKELCSFFKVLTTSADSDNKVYVSTVHAHNYPVTAFQWHLEVLSLKCLSSYLYWECEIHDFVYWMLSYVVH